MHEKMHMMAEILRNHARKNVHNDFTVLLRGAVNNHPRLSVNNRVIRGGYRSSPVISDNPVDNQVIWVNFHLSSTVVPSTSKCSQCDLSVVFTSFLLVPKVAPHIIHCFLQVLSCAHVSLGSYIHSQYILTCIH
jgi:hypothetical protein